MANYQISIIRDKFIEDDFGDVFDIEEGGYEATIRNVKSKTILSVPARINLCYCLNTKESEKLVTKLIEEYKNYASPEDPVTKIELKGIHKPTLDTPKYKNALLVLLSNMVLRQGEDIYTRVSMSKEGTYQKKYEMYNPSKVKLDILKNLLTFLGQNDYIDLYYNTNKSKLETRFIVKNKLSKMLKEYDINNTDVQLSNETTFVELVLEKEKANGRKTKLLINYESNIDTTRREEILQDYNFVLLDWKYRISFKKPMPHIVYARCRYNETIDRGGRVYAPWQWNDISKEDRLKFKIDDSPVVEVDIKSCSLRIACHLLGIDPKQDDLYDISNSSYKRNEIKYTIQQMFNMLSQDSRSLKQRFLDVSNSNELQSSINCTDTEFIKKLAEDIYNYFDTEDFNNLSSKMFFQDKAMTKIMKVETAVVFDVIEYFTSMNEIVLTIHDSYIVRKDLEEELKTTIINSYFKHIGYKPILTTEEGSSGSKTKVSHRQLRELIHK